MGFHRATNFTTNHEAVAAVLERYKKDHEKLVLQINQYLEFARTPALFGNPSGSRAANNSPSGNAPIPDNFLDRIDAIFLGVESGDGSRCGRVDFDSQHRGAAPSDDERVSGESTAGPRVGDPYPQTYAEIQKQAAERGEDLTDIVLLSTRLKLFGGVEYLRYVDGEKHLLFLADPGMAASADDARSLPSARLTHASSSIWWRPMAPRGKVEATVTAVMWRS
jgi:hypothetical protein